MINSKQHYLVPICNHFYVKRANNSKITPFKGGALFLPLVRGQPFTHRHEILSQNTRYSTLSYNENLKSLSHLVLKRYWVVSPGQTDRRRDRQTELPELIRSIALARKNERWRKEKNKCMNRINQLIIRE